MRFDSTRPFAPLAHLVMCKGSEDAGFHGYIDGLAHRSFARGKTMPLLADAIVLTLEADVDAAFIGATCLGLFELQP
jgi:hypothetical protein